MRAIKILLLTLLILPGVSCDEVTKDIKYDNPYDEKGTNYNSGNGNSGTPTVLTVTTASITNIGGTSATGGGNVIADGGSTVTARGVCWSTSTNPTISDSKTTNGTGTGSYTSSLTGLTRGTTYYVRAYAINGAGTAYGSQLSFSTGAYAFGDTGPAGGLIFYDKGSYSGSPSWRYLEAAPSDQTSSVWGTDNYTISGADGTGIGTGYQNTIDIVNGDPLSNTAADICANLTLGGYSDWFLPSKDELNLMYANLHQNGVGNFSANAYWSSSETSANGAWDQRFSSDLSGFQNSSAIKYIADHVRAIRAF